MGSEEITATAERSAFPGLKSETWGTRLLNALPKLLFVLIMPASYVTYSFGEAVNGFITGVGSSTTFDMGTFHVRMTSVTRCSLLLFNNLIVGVDVRPRNSIGEVAYLKPSGRQAAEIERRASIKPGPIPCNTKRMAVGARVRLLVASGWNADTVVPQQVDLFKIVEPAPRGVALIEEAPQMEYAGGTWNGKLWIDGYPLMVDSGTDIIQAPADTKIHYHVGITGYVSTSIPHGKQMLAPSTIVPSQNMWVDYRSVARSDGVFIAKHLYMWKDSGNPKEERFIERFSPKVVTPEYSRQVPGSVLIGDGTEVAHLLADQDTQKWLSKLGEELVAHLRNDLPAENLSKIHFRFYVANSISKMQTGYFFDVNGILPVFTAKYRPLYAQGRSLAPGRDLSGDILTSPDGVILVPDRLLARLKDSAQAAALLSFAITSVSQEQAYRAWPEMMSPWAQRVVCGDASSFCVYFGLWQEEQEIRLGVRTMFLAGYDIREAPFAWTQAAGRSVTNPVIGAAPPERQIPWYAAYGFDYISDYYANMDCSKLKRGEKEYAQFLDELRKADPEAFAKQK